MPFYTRKVNNSPGNEHVLIIQYFVGSTERLKGSVVNGKLAVDTKKTMGITINGQFYYDLHNHIIGISDTAK